MNALHRVAYWLGSALLSWLVLGNSPVWATAYFGDAYDEEGNLIEEGELDPRNAFIQTRLPMENYARELIVTFHETADEEKQQAIVHEISSSLNDDKVSLGSYDHYINRLIVDLGHYYYYLELTSALNA